LPTANIDNTEGVAHSQEGNPQTQSDTLHELQHICDFDQQDYQYNLQKRACRSVAGVHWPI